MVFLRTLMVATCAMMSDALTPGRDRARMRNDIRALLSVKAIRRYQPKIIDPLGNGSAAPVYTPTCEGCSMLTEITGKKEYLLNAEISFNAWMDLPHMLSVAKLAKTIHDAFAIETAATMTSFHFDHEVFDPTTKAPNDRFFLYTDCGDNVRFCPDFAFGTIYRGSYRAWYGEYLTGSDTPARTAAKKSRGVEKFAMRSLFGRHFQEARDFRLLVFSPNAALRDALRKEIERVKRASQYWLFCATNEVTPETFLRGEIWYSVEKGPRALLPTPPSRPPGEDGRVLGPDGGGLHA